MTIPLEDTFVDIIGKAQRGLAQYDPDLETRAGISESDLIVLKSGAFDPPVIRSLAVVGDAVFAGSMGGGAVSYADALRTNRKEILSLPDATILACGHGPLTTVGEQKKSNPFLAVS